MMPLSARQNSENRSKFIIVLLLHLKKDFSGNFFCKLLNELIIIILLHDCSLSGAIYISVNLFAVLQYKMLSISIRFNPLEVLSSKFILFPLIIGLSILKSADTIPVKKVPDTLGFTVS